MTFFDHLAEEGDVVDHLRGDTPADVADNHRVTEVQAQDVGGVDARIEARDDEQAQVGDATAPWWRPAAAKARLRSSAGAIFTVVILVVLSW